MPAKFDEQMFLVALTERDEDSRVFSRVFNPQWLKDKELIPVLESMFEFRKEYGTSASLSALHEYMETKDADMYNARWKVTLTSLELLPKDQSKMILATDKAKKVGSALAMDAMVHGQDFQKKLAEGDGDALLKQVRQYLSQWAEDADGEGVFNIKDAFDKLIDDNAWNGRPDRISSGLGPIDNWTNGGLRPRQLGVLMAPTGGGKSAALANIAHNVATVEQLSVLFITNELSINEQAERFLVRMQKPTLMSNGELKYRTLQEVQDDPSVAFKGLGRRWAVGLEKRLYMASVDLGMTADDVEELVKRLRIEEGFKPDIIVIDYMERMSPQNKVNREKEWIFLGEIAKELVRLAKRLDVLVWTATQTNRAGLSKGVSLDMTHGQGSIRHFQEAAFVGSIQKVKVPLTTEGEQNVNCVMFAEQKQRHNAMEDRTALVKHELSRMYISKEEVFMPEDIDEEVEAENGNTLQKSGSGTGVLAPWAAKGGGV